MKKTNKHPKSSASSLRVIVNEPRIETAIRCNSNRCMIADAIKQAAKAVGWRIGRVRVDLATIRFTDAAAGKRYVFLTPAHARVALILFDSGRKPRPFGFTLRRRDAAQVIDAARAANWPSRAARRAAVKIVTRPSRVRGVKNEAVRRLQNVQITGGRPLPLMPRQTTRMFGFCGLSPQLLQEMTAAVPAA